MNESPLSPASRLALETFRQKTDAPFPPAAAAGLLSSALAASQVRQRNRALTGMVLVLCCLGGMFAVRSAASPGARAVTQELQARPAARWEQEGALVKLHSGRLHVAPVPDRAVTVSTPDTQTLVQNAAAMFEVTERATTIAVESGEVSWRGSGKSGQLKAGEEVRVNSIAHALTLAQPGPRLESCRGAAEATGYEVCLGRAAEGSGLAAQTALFELGLLAHQRADVGDALRQFRTYAERFPTGSFAPEASIGLMLELKQAGRTQAAAAEAERFLVSFPDEPRSPRVRRWAQQFP